MYYTVSVFKLKIINSKYNENVSFSWHWLGSVATMDSIVLGPGKSFLWKALLP